MYSNLRVLNLRVENILCVNLVSFKYHKCHSLIVFATHCLLCFSMAQLAD